VPAIKELLTKLYDLTMPAVAHIENIGGHFSQLYSNNENEAIP